MKPFLIAAILLLAVLAALALSTDLVSAAVRNLAMLPGDTAQVTCSTGPRAGTPTASMLPVTCPAASPTPTPTSTPIVIAGQPCPAAIHDAYKTVGPDGKQYATWHSAVDPTGCLHGHEHGRWQGNCAANLTAPPFGYAAATQIEPVIEPHTGFKTFCLNAGQIADDGRVSNGDYRLVVHMGTSGVGRYIQPLHSIQYDYVARDGSGRYAHVYGMGDFGLNTIVGSTCDVPRKGGRDFSTIGCSDTYEIWEGLFQIKSHADEYQGVQEARGSFILTPAVFDPITTRAPLAPTLLIYTCQVKPDADGSRCTSIADALLPSAWAQGCDREFYGGPNYFSNAGSPNVYYTDPYGWVGDGPGPGMIRQEVAPVDSIDTVAFKYRQSFCFGGPHAPN